MMLKQKINQPKEKYRNCYSENIKPQSFQDTYNLNSDPGQHIYDQSQLPLDSDNDVTEQQIMAPHDQKQRYQSCEELTYSLQKQQKRNQQRRMSNYSHDQLKENRYRIKSNQINNKLFDIKKIQKSPSNQDHSKNPFAINLNFPKRPASQENVKDNLYESIKAPVNSPESSTPSKPFQAISPFLFNQPQKPFQYTHIHKSSQIFSNQKVPEPNQPQTLPQTLETLRPFAYKYHQPTYDAFNTFIYKSVNNKIDDSNQKDQDEEKELNKKSKIEQKPKAQQNVNSSLINSEVPKTSNNHSLSYGFNDQFTFTNPSLLSRLKQPFRYSSSKQNFLKYQSKLSDKQIGQKRIYLTQRQIQQQKSQISQKQELSEDKLKQFSQFNIQTPFGKKEQKFQSPQKILSEDKSSASQLEQQVSYYQKYVECKPQIVYSPQKNKSAISSPKNVQLMSSPKNKITVQKVLNFVPVATEYVKGYQMVPKQIVQNKLEYQLVEKVIVHLSKQTLKDMSKQSINVSNFPSSTPSIIGQKFERQNSFQKSLFNNASNLADGEINSTATPIRRQNYIKRRQKGRDSKGQVDRVIIFNGNQANSNPNQSHYRSTITSNGWLSSPKYKDFSRTNQIVGNIQNKSKDGKGRITSTDYTYTESSCHDQSNIKLGGQRDAYIREKLFYNSKKLSTLYQASTKIQKKSRSNSFSNHKSLPSYPVRLNIVHTQTTKEEPKHHPLIQRRKKSGEKKKNSKLSKDENICSYISAWGLQICGKDQQQNAKIVTIEEKMKSKDRNSNKSLGIRTLSGKKKQRRGFQITSKNSRETGEF